MRQAQHILLAFYAVLLSTLAVPALSQGTPTVDFSVELIQGLPAWTPPGSTGTFKFVVTNLGPDDAVDTVIVQGDVPYNPGEPDGSPLWMTESAAPDNDCVIHTTTSDGPVPPFGLAFFMVVEALAVGESVTCEVEYTVNPDFDFAGDERFPNGGYTVDWTVLVFRDNDPDPDNNTVLLPFRFLLLGRPVPALGPWGLALLALALASAGWVVLRRSAGGIR